MEVSKFYSIITQPTLPPPNQRQLSIVYTLFLICNLLLIPSLYSSSTIISFVFSLITSILIFSQALDPPSPDPYFPFGHRLPSSQLQRLRFLHQCCICHLFPLLFYPLPLVLVAHGVESTFRFRCVCRPPGLYTPNKNLLTNTNRR